MKSLAAKANRSRGSIVAISLLLGSSCSLLFEPPLASDAGGVASDARRSPGDAEGDAETPRAMLMDDFESGERADLWEEGIEAGDSCRVTDEVATDGNAYSLRCSSDNQSGTGAYIYLDFARTEALQVAMDVRFETLPTAGGKWLTYLQASNGSTPLTSSDIYPDGTIDVWRHSDDTGRFARNGDGDVIITTGTWYRIVFIVNSGEAFLSVDSEASARLALPDVSSIDRLLLGITLVGDPIEQHTMYMDNIVITDN